MQENAVAPPSKKQHTYKWLFFLSLLVIGSLAYYYYSDRDDIQKDFTEKNQQLNARIAQLENSGAALSGQLSEKDRQLNDKVRQLSGYMPYQPLLKNLMMADTAYRLLPFRYGQMVYILPDSAPAVVNSISVTVNQYEYAVKYIVRDRKGQLVSVSIQDILRTE